MSNSYKTVMYDHYVTTHNSALYGPLSLEKLRKHFPVLKFYFKRVLPDNKEAAILDIGCGDGNFVYFLQQLGYRHAQGIDLSTEQIERGKKAGISGIQQAEVNHFLALQPGHYDVIVARDVLEHFTKQEIFELCLLVSKSLKPGGRFIVQVPNGQGVFHTDILYGDFTHETAFTCSSLQQLFKNTQFHSVACFSLAPPPVSIVAAGRWFFWQMILLPIRFMKLVVSGSPKGIFTPNIMAVAFKE